MPDRQLEILDHLLKTAERNFNAAVKHADTVDDKAQKTSALAGIFLAVAFGFIKPETLAALRQQYGDFSLGLLYAVLLLFVASVGLCLRAMWLKQVPTGGVSLASQEMSSRFLLDLSTSDLDDEVMAAYKDNEIELWKAAIDERAVANVQKTRLVHFAQQCLAAGILVAAVSIGLLGYAAAVQSKESSPMPEQKSNPKRGGVMRKKDSTVVHRNSTNGAFVSSKLDRGDVLKALKSKALIERQIACLYRTE